MLPVGRPHPRRSLTADSIHVASGDPLALSGHKKTAAISGGFKVGREAKTAQTFCTRPALMAFTETHRRLMVPLGSFTRMR